MLDEIVGTNLFRKGLFISSNFGPGDHLLWRTSNFVTGQNTITLAKNI